MQVITFKHLKNLHSKETINGVSIERINHWFKISKGFFALFFVFSLLKYIRKTDVMIINQPSVEGIIAVVLARILKKKVVSLFHCRLQLGNSLFQKVISSVVNTVVFLELLLSDTIVATSHEYVKEVMGDAFIGKIVIIPPPIMTYPVSSTEHARYRKKKARNIWVGFCGRIAREKGIEYLIAAYEKIRTKIPSTTLIFAGPSGDEVAGEKKYSQKIKKLLKEKNIPHYFFGILSDDEMGAFYKTLDCLVLPSTNSTEAFGMVQAEAMVQGTPVIATDLPGVRVAIKLTGMGVVVPPKNTHKLAQAIIHLITYRSQYANNQLVNEAKKIFDSQISYTSFAQIFSKKI